LTKSPFGGKDKITVRLEIRGKRIHVTEEKKTSSSPKKEVRWRKNSFTGQTGSEIRKRAIEGRREIARIKVNSSRLILKERG